MIPDIEDMLPINVQVCTHSQDVRSKSLVHGLYFFPRDYISSLCSYGLSLYRLSSVRRFCTLGGVNPAPSPVQILHPYIDRIKVSRLTTPFKLRDFLHNSQFDQPTDSGVNHSHTHSIIFSKCFSRREALTSCVRVMTKPHKQHLDTRSLPSDYFFVRNCDKRTLRVFHLLSHNLWWLVDKSKVLRVGVATRRTLPTNPLHGTHENALERRIHPVL